MNYKRFPLGGLWTNGYLFFDEDNSNEAGSNTERAAFFIDPGGDVREVLDYLKKHNLTLKKILLTHGHLDHIAGVEGFLPLVGDEIYIEKKDAHLLKHPPEEIQRALRMECRGVEVFKTLADKDVFSVGEFEIEVIATPGHTQGSVCYLIRRGQESVLASGDTLFAQSVGRTDLPGGDTAMLTASLRKLSSLPDDLLVLPGHGPDTAIGRERKSNPFWPL